MNVPAQRQLRADVARNAERIMREGRLAFAESGIEEIARRAGVGAATLYRRFPNKEELIRAIVEWRYAERVEPALRRALADDDPWHGMVSALEAALRMAAEERGPLLAARDLVGITDSLTAPFFPALATIVRRAQVRGQVRADLTEADLPPLVAMLVSTLRLDRRRADWRRYLGLLLDALRPASATELPESACAGQPAGPAEG